MESFWDQDLSIWVGKKKIQRTYDIDGNLTGKEDYVKGVDHLGQVEWIPGFKSTYVYDSEGNATNVVHHQGESNGNWIADDSIYYTYDDLGSRTRELDFFWSAGSGTWELEKKWEYLFNEYLQMKLQARYNWNQQSLLWEGYSMVMGTSREDNISSVAIGLWSRDGKTINWLSKDESEYSPNGILLRKLRYGWDSNLNDWNIESQRTYSYNEKEELVCEETSIWITEESDFRLDKKVYNFYPGALGAPPYSSGFSIGSLHIFPNPVDELLVVSCTGIPERIDLLNLNGQLMLSIAETELNLFSLPSGIYLLQVHLRNGDVLSGKVIKR